MVQEADAPTNKMGRLVKPADKNTDKSDDLIKSNHLKVMD